MPVSSTNIRPFVTETEHMKPQNKHEYGARQSKTADLTSGFINFSSTLYMYSYTVRTNQPSYSEIHTQQ